MFRWSGSLRQQFRRRTCTQLYDVNWHWTGQHERSITLMLHNSSGRRHQAAAAMHCFHDEVCRTSAAVRSSRSATVCPPRIGLRYCWSESFGIVLVPRLCFSVVHKSDRTLGRYVTAVRILASVATRCFVTVLDKAVLTVYLSCTSALFEKIAEGWRRRRPSVSVST